MKCNISASGASRKNLFVQVALGLQRSFMFVVAQCALTMAAGALAPAAWASQLSLTWSDNSSNESGFKIERSSNGSTYAQVATVGADVVSYTDSGLNAGTSYSYRLRAYNSNGDSAYSNVATQTTPAAANTVPTISNIANTTMSEDGTTGAISFTVSDVETAADSLVVTGDSSNTALVPSANIVFGGSGANRTLTVTPAANQSGSATITVTVSDGALTASDTFVLTVNAVNDAPTISNITDKTASEDGTTGAISFTVGDAETAAGSLVVSGGSSNTALVPSANIVFGGSGANRTVTVTPAANQTGTATITVAVSDGTLTASDTFVLTVSSAQPTGLAGYWKFDEGAGTQAADSSGQGRVGTLLKSTGWTTGKLGGALAFTAADANDRVDMGNFNVSGNKLTLAAWIYVKSIGSDPRIIAKSTGTQTNDLYWLLEIDDGSTPRLGFRVHSGGSLLRLTGGSVEKNQWIHVAGVYDGTTMRIYKNGVEVAKKAKSGSLRTGSASVWVGDNPPNAQRPFEGSIDDVQVYSRALSVAEVQGLHKA